MLTGKGLIAIPPGETIKELLEDRKMSIKVFSERMGMTETATQKLLDGKVYLTFAIADKLEEVLGPRAYFWSRLENRYRENINIIRSEPGAFSFTEE